MTSSNLVSFAPYMISCPDTHHRIPSLDHGFLLTPLRHRTGGIPTFGSTTSDRSTIAEVSEQVQQETRYGTKANVLAAIAYLLGPVSALILLILETHNDDVRFHAYQSALLSTPLITIRILSSLIQAPFSMRTTWTLLTLCFQTYMAYRAYLDTLQRRVHFHLPVVGPIAEAWLANE